MADDDEHAETETLREWLQHRGVYVTPEAVEGWRRCGVKEWMILRHLHGLAQAAGVIRDWHEHCST